MGLVDHVYSSRDADSARLDLTRQFTRHDSSTIRCSKPIADCKVPEPYVASISGAPPLSSVWSFENVRLLCRRFERVEVYGAAAGSKARKSSPTNAAIVAASCDCVTTGNCGAHRAAACPAR